MNAETMTIFKSGRSAQGRVTMFRANLPSGRQLVLMRMRADGLLSDTWSGNDVMLGVNAEGVGANLHLTSEQAMVLGAELLAMATAMPVAIQGGVQ